MLSFMSYEIDDFLNPLYGLLPNIDQTYKLIKAMNKQIE